MVQNEVRRGSNALGNAWMFLGQVERPVARSKRTYIAIQTMSKHFVSPLNSRQTVHKH